jgi:hypothetical protein
MTFWRYLFNIFVVCGGDGKEGEYNESENSSSIESDKEIDKLNLYN